MTQRSSFKTSLSLSACLAQFLPLTHRRQSLQPIRALLARLGNPHHHLPPIIHVAGTNGKGSTIAFLKSCFQAAGQRVHRYISPHLHDYTERIMVADQLISPEALTHYLVLCHRYQDPAYPISLFEALTASAFMAFKETPADVVLLEVGLGGGLDATNIIEQPAISIITPISIDHQAFLGSRIEEIALHKAGIMRPDIPCVISAQPPQVLETLISYAHNLRTPVWAWQTQWRAQRWERQGLAFQWADTPVQYYPALGLWGDHQVINAGAALAALTGFDIPPSARAQGLAQAQWEGRLSPLAAGRIRDLFPAETEVWIDGAHNAGGAEALRHHIQTYWTDQPLVLVIGILARKDSQTFWNILAPLASACYTFSGFDKAALQPEVFAGYAQHTQTPWKALDTLHTALPDRHCRVLFCGSLYFMATVLRENAMTELPDQRPVHG